MSRGRGGGGTAGRRDGDRARGAPRPEKICVACGRPFQWRRKWAACWGEVRYCSDRCRARGAGARAAGWGLH